MNKEKNIIVYVMNLPVGTVEALREHEKEFGKTLRIMLLRDSCLKYKKSESEFKGLDIYKTCDFADPESIAKTLLPYQDELLAITCRSEQSLARFSKVIPHVPYLQTPSTESLKWASDKYEMRKRLRTYDKKITPNFTLVKENSKIERDRVIKKIGFPMIIKPANMIASLFVIICYHEEDLQKNLQNIFSKLEKAYAVDLRLETPKIIAEGFMEGDMYSVDSYVDSRGNINHCPLVKVTTGKNIGHDDFFNYLQMTPTGLKQSTVEKARKTAEKSIHALGLRSTIAHIEMMKIDDEWKIIEVGARMGGFRHVLHKLSCDINHSLNDILVRVPKRTIVPKKCKGFACAMKWFAKKEGKIVELKGIKKIEGLESFHQIDVRLKVGDKALFARNGGRSVFNLFMYNADRSKLLADIRRAELLINIKIGDRTKRKILEDEK